MKFNSSFKTLALASLIALGAPVSVQADDTPLAEQMDTLSGSLKRLRRVDTNAERVGLVQEAQKAVIKSLEYLPEVFKDIDDEKKKADATADYKMLVGQTYVKLCELEMAYLADDEDKADEIKDQLKDLKKEGHDKYTE